MKMELPAHNTLSLTRMHVARTRLQDEVYERLCDLILNGEIAPGQLITVQALCDAFGVSAMPVREALQRLVAAKALTTISGRSIGIPVLTPERLQDLARVRLAVEGEAAEWAVDHVSDEALSRLEHLIDQMDRAVDEQDVKAFIRSNKDFHFTIYQLSGSDVAYAIIEGLWLQIAPYFHDLYVLDRYVKAGDDHRMVLDGLKTRNRSMVGQGIRSDIEGGSRLLLSMLTASRSPGRSTDTEQPVTS